MIKAELLKTIKSKLDNARKQEIKSISLDYQELEQLFNSYNSLLAINKHLQKESEQ